MSHRTAQPRLLAHAAHALAVVAIVAAQCGAVVHCDRQPTNVTWSDHAAPAAAHACCKHDHAPQPDPADDCCVLSQDSHCTHTAALPPSSTLERAELPAVFDPLFVQIVWSVAVAGSVAPPLLPEPTAGPPDPSVASGCTVLLI